MQFSIGESVLEVTVTDAGIRLPALIEQRKSVSNFAILAVDNTQQAGSAGKYCNKI